MSKISKLSLIFVFLLIGFFIGYSAKTIAVVIEDNQNSTARYPRRTILIEIEVNQQELLFDKLRNFAEDEGFAIRIAATTPTGVDYVVAMWREDVKILALNSF